MEMSGRGGLRRALLHRLHVFFSWASEHRTRQLSALNSSDAIVASSPILIRVLTVECFSHFGAVLNLCKSRYWKER